jgi:general secretion pathway protein G
VSIESIVVNVVKTYGKKVKINSFRIRGKKMKAKHGFTLVEILIVVVILGILAAIVIPQFTDAATESKESSLRSDLQTIRSQIELYKIQHNDDLPTAGGLTFEVAMTGYTDQYGAASTQGAVGAFGPYLQTIPVNPFTAGNGVNGASASGSPQGWTFDATPASATYGQFHPSADSSGTDHTIL